VEEQQQQTSDSKKNKKINFPCPDFFVLFSIGYRAEEI